MYETMVLVQRFDETFYKLARMGLISFYMQNYCEEACQVGSIAAMEDKDYVFAQYRELGSFLYRGCSIQELSDLNFSNDRDVNKGKQMPIHYGSKKLNMLTISSPLATQMPQAAGLAYGLKRNKENAAVLCYFGEGAASEGQILFCFYFYFAKYRNFNI